MKEVYRIFKIKVLNSRNNYIAFKMPGSQLKIPEGHLPTCIT